MMLLDRTLPTPAENLACDELLLDQAEAGECQETLRFWEPQEYFVVVGYASKVAAEVNAAACARLGIPILRRCSGGGAVLEGPGCLNYALVLRIDKDLGGISSSNRVIMGRHQQALTQALGRQVEVQGVTDLTLAGRKFSGNSQRRKRRFVLFHGTFLLEFDISLIERCLLLPKRQPDYRRDRTHLDFLVNLQQPAQSVKQVLRATWQAYQPLDELPWPRLDALACEKYSRPEWNLRY
jgi:lipoate-protein ligase A